MLSKSGLKLKIIPSCTVPSVPTATQEVNKTRDTGMVSNKKDIPTAASKASKTAGKRKQSTRKPRGSKTALTA